MKVLKFIPLLFLSYASFAQTQNYLQDARTLSEQKKFEDALRVVRQGLDQKSGDYDLLMLEVRILAWTNDFQLAEEKIDAILKGWPKNGDAWLLQSDIQYWSEDFASLSTACDSAIAYNPNESRLLFKKSVALKGTGNYDKSLEVLQQYLKANPTDELALALEKELKGFLLRHGVGFSYRYSSFDKIFDDWHNASVSYTNYTKAGPLTARMSYANQFNRNGVQYEVEMYPRLSKRVYAFVNTGFSGDQIFPEFKIGGELFVILPRAFEVSAGARYLTYEIGSDVMVYTGQLSKYIGNNWLSVREIMTVIQGENTVTTNLVFRHYFESRDHYLGLWTSFGAAPVEFITLAEIQRLNSIRVGLEYQRIIWKKDLIKISTEFQDEEYTEDFKRKRISAELTYIFRFSKK